jgi:RNA polymerase sigma factor (TIGR02999 family)
MSDRAQLTRLLRSLDLSNPSDGDQLLRVVYDELKVMADRHLRRERAAGTLQSTSLVHEAYEKIAGSVPATWNDRSHFFGIFARAMRQVLVEHARRRQSEKRGGQWERLSLHSQILDERDSEIEVLDLHRALEKLTSLDPPLGKLVELRFFGGFTMQESASVLEVSERKAAKDWAGARLWLGRELSTT